MPKWAKTIVAILLLPFCVGAIRTLIRVVQYSGAAENFWVAFLGGAGCWLAIFLLLPKPLWIYVVGHEFTHALWTWLFGGRVKRFRATAKGGHVVISKTNFIIALAPYFFPVYVAGVILLFAAGHLFWGWSRYLAWFHLFTGAAYAFHLTLTFHILRTRQSDITQQGYLFSAVIILLGNVAVLIVGIPLLTTRLSVLSALGWWLTETGATLQRAAAWM